MDAAQTPAGQTASTIVPGRDTIFTQRSTPPGVQGRSKHSVGMMPAMTPAEQTCNAQFTTPGA